MLEEKSALTNASKSKLNQTPIPISKPTTLSVSTKKTSALTQTAATLVGCWQWSNGAKILIRENGVADNGFAPGRWYTTSQPALYRIDWPPIVDRIILEENHNTYRSTGLFDVTLTAKKLETSSSQENPLVGSWQRQDNVVLTYTLDGKVSTASFKGTWKPDDNNYIAEWPVIDDVELLPNSNHLKITNQFGQLTAEKTSGCAE